MFLIFSQKKDWPRLLRAEQLENLSSGTNISHRLFSFSIVMARFHTATAMPLSPDLFPHSNSDGLLKYIGIAIAKKWVLYPTVSDIAIAMWKCLHRIHPKCTAIAVWKWSITIFGTKTFSVWPIMSRRKSD